MKNRQRSIADHSSNLDSYLISNHFSKKRRTAFDVYTHSSFQKSINGQQTRSECDPFLYTRRKSQQHNAAKAKKFFDTKQDRVETDPTEFDTQMEPVFLGNKLIVSSGARKERVNNVLEGQSQYIRDLFSKSRECTRPKLTETIREEANTDLFVRRSPQHLYYTGTNWNPAAQRKDRYSFAEPRKMTFEDYQMACTGITDSLKDLDKGRQIELSCLSMPLQKTAMFNLLGLVYQLLGRPGVS